MNKRPPEVHNKRAETVQAPPRALARLREIWMGSCARYTVLCLILLVTSSIASDSLTITYVDTVRFFLLLPFGVCLTLAAWARRSDKLPAGAKVGLHALSTLGGFYLFCYLPYQLRTKPTGMQVFIILLAVMLLYAVVMGVYAAVSAKARRKKLDDIPYESQFGK